MVRDGYIYAACLIAVAGVLIWFTHGWGWAVAPILLALFFLWFFRDPSRIIPSGQGVIVSPGDGHVTEVASISTPEGSRRRIGVFLSVFDVHVNRAPIGGILSSVRYRSGRYLNAMNPESAECNEQNVVTVRGQGPDQGVEVTFKQIAGLLARRIVFNLREGQTVERGQRVGLIKFGSRVDVVFPAEAVVQVEVGQRVKGGETILAVMPAGEHA